MLSHPHASFLLTWPRVLAVVAAMSLGPAYAVVALTDQETDAHVADLSIRDCRRGNVANGYLRLRAGIAPYDQRDVTWAAPYLFPLLDCTATEREGHDVPLDELVANAYLWHLKGDRERGRLPRLPIVRDDRIVRTVPFPRPVR